MIDFVKLKPEDIRGEYKFNLDFRNIIKRNICKNSRHIFRKYLVIGDYSIAPCDDCSFISVANIKDES